MNLFYRFGLDVNHRCFQNNSWKINSRRTLMVILYNGIIIINSRYAHYSSGIHIYIVYISIVYIYIYIAPSHVSRENRRGILMRSYSLHIYILYIYNLLSHLLIGIKDYAIRVGNFITPRNGKSISFFLEGIARWKVLEWML